MIPQSPHTTDISAVGTFQINLSKWIDPDRAAIHIHTKQTPCEVFLDHLRTLPISYVLQLFSHPPGKMLQIQRQLIYCRFLIKHEELIFA